MKNSAGLTSIATAVISVTETSAPPVAAFSFSGGGKSGANNMSISYTVPTGGSVAIGFNGTNSQPGSGSITKWSWTSNGTAISTQPSFSYTFGHGTHNLALTVKNSAGLTSTATAVISVQ